MKIQINDTAAIPAVGFDTYLIDDAQAELSVAEALQAGYRHIDTAEGYQNEAGVGRALRTFGLGRDEVFITTKLWPGNPAWGHPTKDYAATIAALDSSLHNLGLECVDLYLIHAPFARAQRLEQWQALEELRRQGKARCIGVSNFSSAHLEEIQAAGLSTPDVNQIELHPWSQKPELTSYMRQHGITAVAYSSLVPLAEWRVDAGRNPRRLPFQDDGCEVRGNRGADPAALGSAEGIRGVTQEHESGAHSPEHQPLLVRDRRRRYGCRGGHGSRRRGCLGVGRSRDSGIAVRAARTVARRT